MSRPWPWPSVGAGAGAGVGAVGAGAGASVGAVGAGAATGAVSLASMAPTRADRASSWPDSVSSLARVPGLAGVPVGLAGSIPSQASMAIVIAPDLVRPWAWACDSSKARVLPSNLAVMGNLAIIFLP